MVLEVQCCPTAVSHSVSIMFGISFKLHLKELLRATRMENPPTYNGIEALDRLKMDLFRHLSAERLHKPMECTLAKTIDRHAGWDRNT